MSNALDNRSKSSETVAMAMGIVFIAVATVICYIVGYLISQSDSFVEKTAIHFIFKRHGLRYFCSSFSMIVPIIMYAVKFKDIAGRDKSKYSFIKMDGGSADYVYKGWAVFALVTAVVTCVAGFLIHCIAFKWQLNLVKPLMIWVLLAQSSVSGLAFAMPFCKPLKKA